MFAWIVSMVVYTGSGYIVNVDSFVRVRCCLGKLSLIICLDY